MLTNRKKNKLVCGVGINDANYKVSEKDASGKQNRCPFYTKWVDMLNRCYSDKLQNRYPTYRGCTVCEEWKTFSKFKAWMEQQDWNGKHLDKDILMKDNKLYCPEYCVFVNGIVNKFLIERTSSRGQCPIGVYFHERIGMFRAQCGNPFTKKQEYLGYFCTAEEAHSIWLKRKREHAKVLASLQTDCRVSKALIDRYNVDTYNQLHEVLYE